MTEKEKPAALMSTGVHLVLLTHHACLNSVQALDTSIVCCVLAHTVDAHVQSLCNIKT